MIVLQDLESWFSREQQQAIASLLVKRVGLTRTRSEYFVRLWVYLLVKQWQEQKPYLKPPLTKLDLPIGAVVCTHREAAELFYGDRECGSDRAAGMMLSKLAALGLVKKHFDGNSTSLEIQAIPEVLNDPIASPPVQLQPDHFDSRCDAVPVANLLAKNYNWMNRNTEAVPHRIARLLRQWAGQYSGGMRVLRRCDNLNPVGFYLLYPVVSESEVAFFNAPSKSIHLSSLVEVDPFKMALPGDERCITVFIRSWMIDPLYLKAFRIPLVEDVQQAIAQLRQDFPNLCDLYSLIIHPSYEELAEALGFQRIGVEAQSVYWVYLAVDRFLSLDIKQVLGKMNNL